MKKVLVEASLTYEVLIEKGLLNKAGRLIKSVHKGKNAVIISDSNVFPLYGKILEDSLRNEGFNVLSFVFPAGEGSKNTDTLVSLWEFLAESHITRSDALIALGGGVTGDLTGFAAATFLRGISYIGIPTSLLAMVDSSVGGKTAVDLKGGKNLAGAFYQPSLVIIDPSVLETLPYEIYCDGMAEVIKYGMINLPSLLSELSEDCETDDIIEACIKDKRDIVNEDERDLGVRQLLNFGHTPAHAIELLSDFGISHGSAVSIGMVLMTRAAIKQGLCKGSALQRLITLLKKYSLPTDIIYSPEKICEIALNDKKRSQESITLAVPLDAGECILKKIPVEDLYNFISGAWEND